MAKLKLFISSVQNEFSVEREALYQYLHADALLGNFIEPFLFERTPAKDASASRVFLNEARNCDIYIGLFGKDYGYEDEEGISPTEREFNEATRLYKHRFIYLKEMPVKTRHPKMQELIRKVERNLIRKQFNTTSELISGVYASLVDFLQEQGFIRTVPFDAAPAQGATLDDISEDKVHKFIENARNTRGFPASASGSIHDVLLHLNLIQIEKVSHAGILLFGKAPQRFLISSEVKCAHFHGTEVEKPAPSYQVYKGDVFELVDQSVDFVMSKITAKVGERNKSSRAPVDYEIPRAAVAEGIVNAIAHRDYSSTGSVQVMLFADRLEIWNPGRLPSSLTVEQLKGPHGSVPSNPLLAEPMYLTGYIERLGTGTRDIIRLCANAGLPEPEFIQESSFRLIFWRNKKYYRTSTEQVPDKYRTSTGQVWQEQRTTKEIEKLILVVEGEMSNSEMMDALGLKHRPNFRDNYLMPALSKDFIEMTIPEKPQSSKQKYRLTDKGEELQHQLLKE